MSAAHGDALDRELDRWESPATLWLRDDDAVTATPALDRLIALAEAAGAPLALAVIPAGADAALAARLARAKDVSVLQHGYAHANHAALGAKKSEYADGRPLEAMMGELVLGRATIQAVFGEQALPVFAPPWNRAADALIRHLPELGLTGLSRFKPRAARMPVAGLTEANAHVDLIDWRGGRMGKPAAAVMAEIAAHLAARRTGAADPEEATGILAHHLAMDDGAWDSLRAVLGCLGGDGRIAWARPAALFADAP